MICYRDMTFCTSWEKCEKGVSCPRALTPLVQKSADIWWDGFKSEDPAPIMVYTEAPDCFKEKK